MKHLLLPVLALLTGCAETRAGTVWLEWSDKTEITDGSAGSPVRVATAHDFDSYLNGLPENTTIHLIAGTFQTETYFNVKSGWNIIGEGIDSTILQVSDLGPAPKLGVWWQAPIFSVFCSGLGKSIRGARICGLTVDCNFQNQTYAPKGMNMEAVSLYGDDLRVERVKAINFGSTQKNSENFVIMLGYTGKQWRISGLTLDGCVVTQPASNASDPAGATSLLIAGLAPELRADNHELDRHSVTKTGPGWSFGAEVKNCKVYDLTQAAAANVINIAYQAQCRIHDNTILNCPGSTGIYGENIAFDGLEVANNFISNVANGFLLATYGFENSRLRRNLTIRDNTIQNVSGLGISIFGSMSPKANGFENVAILDNVVAGGFGCPAIGIDDATNLVIENNILNAPQNSFQLGLRRDARAIERNNNNFDGSKLKVKKLVPFSGTQYKTLESPRRAAR